jgi:hypothetical protein
MKINIDHLIAFVFAFCISFIAIIFLYGCSAQYHLRKYQDKGGTCGVIDTIQIVDSFPIIQKDTIIWRYYTKDSLVIVNDRVVPKTIREIRYDERLRRDTLRIKEKEIRYQWKEKRNDDRKAWIWVAMAAMALAAIYMIKRW